MQLPYSKWFETWDRDLDFGADDDRQVEGDDCDSDGIRARRPASVHVGSTAISVECLTIPYSC